LSGIHAVDLASNPALRHTTRGRKVKQANFLMQNTLSLQSPAFANGARTTPSAPPRGFVRRVSTFRLIVQLIKDSRDTPRAVLVASFLINLLALALPLTILQVYDRVIPNAAYNTLTALLAALFTVVVFDTVLKIARNHLVSRAVMESAFKARVTAAAKLLYGDQRKISAKPRSYWFDRMSAVEEMGSMRGAADRTVLLDIPFIVIFLFMTGLIGGWLVLVPLTLIVAFAAVMLWLSGKQRRLMDDGREEDERRYGYIVEWLGGIATIKTLAMEPQIQRQFEEMMARASAYSFLAAKRNNRVPALGQLFSNLMMVSVITGGAVFVIDGVMSIGSLACCSLLATRVAQPMFRAISVWTQIEASTLAEMRAQEILDLPIGPLPGVAACTGAIELADVHVPPRGRWNGFEKLRLRIEPGDFIGITGGVGSGKSTLLALLNGSLAPASGEVRVDGVDIASPEGAAMRHAIQTIDGRITLMRGSIIENIAMFRTGPFLREAVAAVELMGFHEQINGLAEGYDTQVGDGSPTVLPQGFQQSLMIARALAHKPGILLIDDVNALFDAETQRRLSLALEALSGAISIVLVSSNTSLLRQAHRIFALRDGFLSPLADIDMPPAVADAIPGALPPRELS
jgi:ATP-binding cassette, subfamily C, bacterial LapB